MKLNISMFRKLLLLLVMVCSLTITQAQEKAVTGTVTDANDGMGIPGVSVVVKGTTTGTSTDIDGHFSISAEASSTLVFSFIGYKSQEILVGDQTQFNIVLSTDTENLSEVVVIGYGQVKKEDATGSVTAIGADDFNGGVVTSPQDLIVGKSAGIQITSAGGEPGAGSTIRIRGGASLSANNDPLFVIDGIPLESKGINGIANPLSTINPKDIETFTVLKDASATAIYGSRASNGVILITTKKGKASQDIKVDYSGKFSISNSSKRLDVYNADEYKTLVSTLYGNDSDAFKALGDANTNWQDEIYQVAVGTDHSVGISGGLEKLPYRLSIGYNYQDGVLKTSNIERNTINLNLSPSFFDNHLKANFSFKGSKVKNRFADKGAIGAAIGFDPTHPVKSGTEDWGGYYQWVDNNNIPLKFTPTNPLSLLEQTKDKSDVYRGIANLNLDYKFHFLPELSAVMNVGVDYVDSDGSKTISPDASWMYNHKEEISEYNKQVRGEKKDFNQEKENLLFDFYLNYTKTIKEHSFNAMAGYSWQKFKEEGSEFKRDFFEINTKAPVQFASDYYLISFFGRLNYTLKDRYLLTGTIRRDGTSRFNPDGGNQWGVFPSAAFAWKIKEESFLADVDFLSDLKLRLGWGVTGQQDVSGSAYVGYSTYKQSNDGAEYIFGDDWFYTFRPSGIDPNLKWEETTSTNIGLDFSFFKNRLSGSVDYYKKETNDLINSITVAAGTNLSDKIITNVGSLENKGIELNLVGRPIVTKDFYWELGANFTHNKNEITKLTAVDDPNYQGVPAGDIGSGRNIQIHKIGEAASSFYVYEQVYRNGKPLEGVYVDQNEDGVINSSDKIIKGNPTPDFLVGLNTNFRYKNWDLSLSGRFQFGGEVYNSVKAGNANWYNIYNATTTALSNRLVASNDNEFTQSDEQRRFSSHWIEKANFFRLDNLTLGYNFDSAFGNEDNRLRLYLTAQNLFTISSYDGIDPEVFNGIDNNLYPRPMTIVMGINFGF